jgi:Fe-S-cluster containining protein
MLVRNRREEGYFLFITFPCQHPINDMVAFVCTWCGKCCASFGAFIKIERQLTSRDYYCRYGIKNELFLAHIEGEYADSQSPLPEEGDLVKGCPFMRKNRKGNGIACAIYATRPRICREFRCYRMVIYGPDIHECARIMGRYELKTSDQRLAEIWKDHITPLVHTDDAWWEKTVIGILAGYSYRGERVE